MPEPESDPGGCWALTEPAALPEAPTVLPEAALPAGAVRDGWLVAGSCVVAEDAPFVRVATD